MQPTGQVPLVGLASQLPFFKRLLNWAGIKVHSEAREQYKSMVAPFTETDSLTPEQLANQADLLGDLNHGYAHAVGANRFPKLDGQVAAEHVAELACRGPFSAREAEQAGLIDGTRFKRELVQELVPKTSDDEEMAESTKRWKTLAHYVQLSERTLQKTLNKDQVVKVGVVYLLGGISQLSGPNSVSAALQGLKEAAADPDIKAVVLRIDSGGGDVVASETLWDAVRRMRQEHKKPIVASFGNAAASGAYYVASAADAIFANESTITGSIGVAALRPTVTQTLLDRLQMHVQTIFTGSTAQSSLQVLDEAQKQRMARHIDETYADFLGKVREGRGISDAALRQLAGGRVWTGLAAWTECDGPNAQVDKLLAPFKAGAPPMPLTNWSTETSTNESGIDVVRIVQDAGIDAPDVELEETQKAALAADLKLDYGRGLIDAIGGLWDASMYATALTLQAEVEELQHKLGISEEAATALLRPGCARVSTGENTALSADLRLVRFPADRPFWQRLQQYDVRTEPNLASRLALLAAQPLLAFWHTYAAPASLPELVEELGQRMPDASATSRIQAEYPFRTHYL